MSLKCPKLKFNTTSSPEIKLSDDRLSACRKNITEEIGNSYLFSDQCLFTDDEFQVQIIHLVCSQSESLQFGVLLDNPNKFDQFISEKDGNLRNSISLRKNVLFYQNDENVVTSEEYELNLSVLREGDLIGVKITEARELFFTHNGVTCRKAADNLPKDVWAFVNLCGQCSFISIVPTSSSITISHKDKVFKAKLAIKEHVSNTEERKVNFHDCCGKEVILTDNNCVARRKNPTNEFRNAVVISNGPLVTNEMFRLRIEGLINKWNGSIELGVTFHNPDMFELPTAMNNLRSGTLVLSGNSILTNGHGTKLPYCTTSLDDLKIGDEIGIVRKDNSNIHFFINNKDMGIAGNIPVDKDLWVIADLYGRTIKVSIPRESQNVSILGSELTVDMKVDNLEDSLVFHSICGKNIKLSNDMTRASRINDQAFNNGVVFTCRPLSVGEMWTVKLMRCVEQWAGNLELGVSTKCPGDPDIPSTMTDLTMGYTVMLTSNGVVINGCPFSQVSQTTDIDNAHPILVSGIPSLVLGNTLGVCLLEDSKIQFFINGADLGYINLETTENVYGVIDLYGKAAEVSICNIGFEREEILSVNLSNSTLNDDDREAISNYQTLLFSEENNDFGRSFSLLQSESGLCDALKDADRSFLRSRLLSRDDEFSDKPSTSCQEPLLFHHIHGRNVYLSNDSRTAYRPSPNNEFKNALVMSSRPLQTDEIFEICIDKMTDHWSGSLEMGVTLNKPVELNFPGTLSQLDKDCWILSGSCIMNNGITARNDYSLDMDTITVRSRIGLIRRRSGMLHFLLDGKDMGAAYFDVPSGIYAILDLYGQCSKVSLTNNTGTSSSVDQAFDPAVAITNNEYPLIREPKITIGSQDAHIASIGSSRLSPFDRVMQVFKENIPGPIEEEGLHILSRRLNLDQKEHTSHNQDDDNSLRLFTEESLCGEGVRCSDSENFRADDPSRNCVIQSKNYLKRNIYYEFVFHISRYQSPNNEPISFGFTSEKFSSHKYLPEKLYQMTPPNRIFLGEKLLVDSKDYSLNFAPVFSNLRRQVYVGLLLHEDSSLEIFADRVRLGSILSDTKKNLYMLVDLSGWYDSLTSLNNLRRRTVSTGLLSCHFQRPYCGYLNEIVISDNDVEFDDASSTENEMNNLPENPEIEDSLMVDILNELYEVLPLFMVRLKGIDTDRLVEKMVVSNNDIVLNVRREIGNGNTNRSIQKNTIQHLLVKELSIRFSYLSELGELGNSSHEIARVLRRQVHLHGTDFDVNAKVFAITGSCVYLEDSKLSRSVPGSNYGLVIINHELRSEKYKSYEIQTANTDSGSQLMMGMILIESKHFPKAEDAFRFLLTLKCPKHINSFSNYINLELDMLHSECPALVLLVDDDSTYLNGQQICHNMPFNICNASVEQFLSLRILQTETALFDVYLSIRTRDSRNNHLVLSQTLLDNCLCSTTVSPRPNSYLYLPFVWLKNVGSVSVVTEPVTLSQPLFGFSPTNPREWLEKHYNDELNKESSCVQRNESAESGERLCVSLKRSSFLKSSLSLPDTYFKNKSATCFCNNCRATNIGSTNISSEVSEVFIKGDPSKEFRLPLGWVKFNIRLRREERHSLSLWHLGYLTVSSSLIHRLLASPDPVSVLKCDGHALSPLVSWMRFDSAINKHGIVISPWQPLSGGYLVDDRWISRCSDAEVTCYDPHLGLDTVGHVSLEVRVKPNTYESVEYKIVTESGCDESCIVIKDLENGAAKKIAESSSPRPINQKTVWILHGEANCLVISGLLIKII